MARSWAAIVRGPNGTAAISRPPTSFSWCRCSTLGGTMAVVIVTAATCLIFVGTTMRWRPGSYFVTLLLGELAMFLIVAAVVRRTASRHSSGPPPGHTCLPSGHLAAARCIYAGLAIPVIEYARGRWRWLFLIPAASLPVLVAASRIYRGEYHPTDVLARFGFRHLGYQQSYC